MNIRPIGFLVVAVSLLSSGCSSSSSSGSAGNAPVSVAMEADYVTTAAPKGASMAPSACPGTPTTSDGPQFTAGSDCDGDGGVVSLLTPAHFTVAVKRLSFVSEGGERVDIIPDALTLAAAQRFDLSSPMTVAQTSIPSARYTQVEVEIYYFEITMPLNSAQTQQTIRVYMSDDDFPAEGSLGHHQGDITFIDSNGNELGWVGVGTAWNAGALQTNAAAITRPGSTDAETGHQRGHFGDTTLWDQTAFAQGATQDIFLISGQLNLDLTTQTQPTVKFTFNVKDTWFWEDFDGTGQNFNPCEGGSKDACDPGAEWAPLFRPPLITVN